MRRVLLVDDEPAVLKAYGRVLRSLPVELETAASADEALARLGVLGCDVVITDHDMREHDGVWLLRQVRSRWPRSRRILMSGRDVHDLDGHLASGLVHRFLAKPIDSEALRAALQEDLSR